MMTTDRHRKTYHHRILIIMNAVSWNGIPFQLMKGEWWRRQMWDQPSKELTQICTRSWVTVTIRDYWYSMIIMKATLNELWAICERLTLDSMALRGLYLVPEHGLPLDAKSPSRLVTEPIVEIISHHHPQQQSLSKTYLSSPPVFRFNTSKLRTILRLLQVTLSISCR